MPQSTRGLARYRKKRDFSATPEPSGRNDAKRGFSFVIQEHHARSHHFDFRLEMNGVLVSWAVPKGIPEDPAAKRLAVHVEDHPLEYGAFEGEIPKGHYGAGHVEIWDRGTWEPIERAWKKSFAKGELKFFLHGTRLQGSYVLIRMDEPNWLLRKHSDASAALGKTRQESATFVKPELARVVSTVPQGRDWLHEIKLDGYRIIAVKRGKSVTLHTRTGLDWTAKFGTLAEEISRLSEDDFVLDGEAVVFDENGRTDFGGLQLALKHGGGIDYVAFDLLHLAGNDLRELPLKDRLENLRALLPDGGERIRRSHTWSADEGPSLFREACKAGLEGIISKPAKSPYRPGSRQAWVKSKCRARQEFVICGYTPPKASCPAFGALVLGSWENGKLVPRGKVGTGFTETQRHDLLKIFRPHETKTPLFPGMKSVHWLEPKLVAEIEFAEITRDGSIRQGSYLGLREDKSANEVKLEATKLSGTMDVKVAGITITHPDREVFPGDSITKREVAEYYQSVARWMLPFVINRPLAVLRAPEGITGQAFFQKSFPQHLPPHVTARTLADGTDTFTIRDAQGLVSLAQFGVIEFHPWGAPVRTPDKPDVLVWDLDPDPAVPWPETLGAAFLLRDFLADHGLETRVKTSGGKGLHVMLFLKRQHTWEILKPFTKAVAAAIREQNPGKFTIESAKAKRKGKIYLDWLRNGRGATCVAPFSLRARPGAPVSRPLDWAELHHLDPHGFSLREPVALPKEWKSIKPQSLPKTLVNKILHPA